MRKVVKIDLNDKAYGGRVYENEMIALLDKEVEFERVFIMKHKFKPLNVFRLLWLIIKYKFLFDGILLLTNQTTFFASKKSRNIVVVHHIERNLGNSPSEHFQRYCDNYLFRNSDRYAIVIAVAECWKRELVNAGFKDVRVIYNSFDQSEYSFTPEVISDFKNRYGLDERPLIYLGNCQMQKGVVESYRALKGEGYQLVTSGRKQVDIPAVNLDLPFADYKVLLAASDVVLTMSKFTEGWNRTAHEASLCGTPVIGTGTGGMHELLEMAGQSETKDYSKLPVIIKERLSESYHPTKELLALNKEYFYREWHKVLCE